MAVRGPGRGAGVADQVRLESVCGRKSAVGSNPTLSASTESELSLAASRFRPRGLWRNCGCHIR